MKSFLFGAFIEYLSLDHGGARWRTTTALLLSNALVIVGAVVLHWSFGAVLFLFWAENIVIGGLQVLKMLFRAARFRDWRGFFQTAPFFTVHFGGFTFGQGLFMGILARQTGTSLVDEVAAALTPPESTTAFLEGLWPPLLLATLSHLYSFWKHTVQGASAKGMMDLMFEPYGRIVVMQVTVLGGAWVLNTFTDRGLGPLVLMMLAKTALDFSAHFKQHAG